MFPCPFISLSWSLFPLVTCHTDYLHCISELINRRRKKRRLSMRKTNGESQSRAATTLRLPNPSRRANRVCAVPLRTKRLLALTMPQPSRMTQMTWILET